MSEIHAKPSRRGFVLATIVAGAGAAAVATLPKPTVPPLPEAEAGPHAPAGGGGYRASEHVQRYYRTTRT